MLMLGNEKVQFHVNNEKKKTAKAPKELQYCVKTFLYNLWRNQTRRRKFD